MTKYRENSINIRDFESICRTMIDPQNPISIFNVYQFVMVDPTLLSRDDYHTWVLAWKDYYNAVGHDIRAQKNVGDHRNVYHLQRLANLLLNARQHAKDTRRAARQRSAAV